MVLSKPQQTIAASTVRFRVVVAGRRFGKTFLAIRELCRFASKPNQTVWMLAASRQQVKTLVWSKLKKKLKQLRWLKTTNESELTISLVNGSKICLKSAEQGDTLRGESLNFVVIDEFCDVDLDDVWAQILRPSLSDQLGHALFLGTPKAGNQAARDLFDKHLTNTNWASFSYTTAEGGFVTEDEIAQAQQDLAPKVFKQEYLASWENFAGVIFSEFGEHNIRPVVKPLPSERILCAIDFNITPISCIVGRQTATGVEFYDEIFMDNSNTTELVQEIRNRYPANPVTCFPDPSGVARKTSANGNTDVKILELAGFTVKYHRSHPLVKDRINACNSLFFKRPDNSTRLYIDPSCKTTIKCFKNWSYKPDTMIPDKDSGYDHACDAAGYLIEYLYPITKVTETPPPERFGVR